MHSLVGTDETERSNWTRREDTLVLGRDELIVCGGMRKETATLQGQTDSDYSTRH